VRDFDGLVADAAAVPIDGWDFTWMNGRAIEERPSWHYFDRVVERVDGVTDLLELQAGTGSLVGALPVRPRFAAATEGFAPSVAVAAPKLRACNVCLVVTSQTREALPFADGAFMLTISRHPIDVWWSEIARVLRPGGAYFAQHVGPHSLRSLSERFLGPLSDDSKRDPDVERRAAEEHGLVVRSIEVEHPRTAFYDIGAVVYFLRLVPWIVPGFTVSRYRAALRELHTVIEREGAFETRASRMLVEAVKPA
jgi:SAM-dependent methyltransferase